VCPVAKVVFAPCEEAEQGHAQVRLPQGVSRNLRRDNMCRYNRASAFRPQPRKVKHQEQIGVADTTIAPWIDRLPHWLVRLIANPTPRWSIPKTYLLVGGSR
jgi:hypothetical protein